MVVKELESAETGGDAGRGLDLATLDALLDRALEEDLGPRPMGGDLTSEVAVGPQVRATARLLAKQAGVVAGLPAFERAFRRVEARLGASPVLEIELTVQDGGAVEPGDELARLAGPARTLLVGERTALNLLGRLCGIATLTRAYVERAGGARILDTRKTTPGLRALEKYAVRCGGGENHRMGLFDEAMIKDNHLDGGGWTTGELLAALRARHGEALRITAEARDEAEALEAVHGGADVVMLDNLPPAEMARLVPRLREAARARARALEIEASGGVSLTTVAAIADSGVDRISVGALTHSAPALDLSLALEVQRP